MDVAPVNEADLRVKKLSVEYSKGYNKKNNQKRFKPDILDRWDYWSGCGGKWFLSAWTYLGITIKWGLNNKTTISQPLE